MRSEINTNRYVPSVMNGHMDYMLNANCEIFYTTTPVSGKFLAIAYHGKSKVKSWFYNFKSEERMMEYIEKFVAERKLMEANVVARKASQKAKNDSVKVEVGQIFKYSWGYDQTNVDYYQVISAKGKTAVLRNINAKTVAGSEGFMCCNVVPVKDSFVEGNMADTITKRVKAGYDGEPCFSMDFGTLSLTSETTSSYCSWYA